MSEIVSLEERRSERKREIAEYVKENCEEWDSYVLVSVTADGMSITTSQGNTLELIGMIEVAKIMLSDESINA